jgi:hypothetical protein
MRCSSGAKLKMNTIDSLDISCQTSKTSLATKWEILNHLWDKNIKSSEYASVDADYGAYITCYIKKCNQKFANDNEFNLVRTPRDTIDIAT